MTGLIKMALIGAGIVGAVIGAAKLNDIYKEKHDGKGIVEDAMNTMEEHPVATMTVGIVALTLGTAAAGAYIDTHRTPEWYEHQEKLAEYRAEVRKAEIEDDRKRDEFNTLLADKKKRDELDFYKQMPAEYWDWRSSVEDRKAREAAAESIVAANKYVSDNELEATKYVSDNDLEAKKVKANKNAKEQKEENVA